MQSIGERIKDLRKRHQLSGSEFGELCDVSKGLVSQWEGNQGLPSTERLLILQKKLKFSLDWLLCGDEKPLARKVQQDEAPYADIQGEHGLTEAYRSLPGPVKPAFVAIVIAACQQLSKNAPTRTRRIKPPSTLGGEQSDPLRQIKRGNKNWVSGFECVFR